MRRHNLLRQSDPADESLVNLTPLIDVVFVVLIAFILIAPLLEVEHIELAQTTLSAKKDISKKSGLTIYVAEDNSIRVNNRKVTMKELPVFLREQKEAFTGLTPQVFHDNRASFGTYQKIKDALERAGFMQMDLILKPQNHDE